MNFLVGFPFPPLFLHPVIFALYLNTNLVNGLTCLATCTTKMECQMLQLAFQGDGLIHWKVVPLVWKTYLKFYKTYWNQQQQQQHEKLWRYSFLKRAQIGKDCHERSCSQMLTSVRMFFVADLNLFTAFHLFFVFFSTKLFKWNGHKCKF